MLAISSERDHCVPQALSAAAEERAAWCSSFPSPRPSSLLFLLSSPGPQHEDTGAKLQSRGGRSVSLAAFSPSARLPAAQKAIEPGRLLHSGGMGVCLLACHCNNGEKGFSCVFFFFFFFFSKTISSAVMHALVGASG